MFPSKVFTLKTKNNTNFGFNYKDYSYIVGFNNKLLANKCNSIVHQKTIIDIDIKKLLTPNTNIVNMIISKMVHFQDKNSCEIDELDIATFLTYPILKHIPF
jgi:hypothetical protein